MNNRKGKTMSNRKCKTISNRKNKAWMRNPDQLKNPKFFQLTMMRGKDGAFHVLGGECKYLNRVNQHINQWVNVNTRDFVAELRNSPINCL